jgi:hypothetical protein
MTKVHSFQTRGSVPLVASYISWVSGAESAALTAGDGRRLRAVARHHRSRQVLLATWIKGKAARFFCLRQRNAEGFRDLIEVEDLDSIR